MATGKLLVAVIPARKAAKGPRKKRKRLEPRAATQLPLKAHEKFLAFGEGVPSKLARRFAAKLARRLAPNLINHIQHYR
jgi:hypothetical protein